MSVIESKDLLVQIGVPVTFLLGIINLYFNLKAGKRTAFVNTVTSERVKWIAKVRENVSTLCSLCDQWMFHRTHDSTPELQRQIEKLKNEIRLQLNPGDGADRDIERLLARLPNMSLSMTPEEYLALQSLLVSTTQEMLKREWDKVKDEAMRGDLRAK